MAKKVTEQLIETLIEKGYTSVRCVTLYRISAILYIRLFNHDQFKIRHS